MEGVHALAQATKNQERSVDGPVRAAVRDRPRSRSPRGARPRGGGRTGRARGRPTGWGRPLGRSAPRARPAGRASQSRTAVSATRRARRWASLLISSKVGDEGKLHLAEPARARAKLGGVHARTVALARARPAVAVAAEGGGVAAAHAVALTLDEVFIRDRWIPEAGDERERGRLGGSRRREVGDLDGGLARQLLHTLLRPRGRVAPRTDVP